MKRPSWIVASLILPLLLPAHARLKALTLEEACSDVDLAVMGTPRLAGRSLVLNAEKTLFGRPPAMGVRFPGEYEADGTLVSMRESCGTDPASFRGQRRIWLLCDNGDGTFHAAHPARVRGLDDLVEVEKALQVRLRPFVEALRSSTELDLRATAPPPRKPPPTPTQSAFAQLQAAGPAALPGIRELLAAPAAGARAWGCELAASLKEPSLAGDLRPLLEDAAAIQEVVGDVMQRGTVGSKALAALGELAGTPFGTAEAADAWARHGGALCPACAGKGIAHYIVSCKACGKADKEGKCCAGPHARADLCSDCAVAKSVCLGCGKPSAP